MDAPYTTGLLGLFLTLINSPASYEGQPPIKQALTAAIDTCESRPGHFIIWSVKQGSLGDIPLSPCHCFNKVETGACPLGYSWWQVSPSDSAATHNALSHSQGPEGTMGSLSLKKLGCVWRAPCILAAFTPEAGGFQVRELQKSAINTRHSVAFGSAFWLFCICFTC